MSDKILDELEAEIKRLRNPVVKELTHGCFNFTMCVAAVLVVGIILVVGFWEWL